MVCPACPPLPTQSRLSLSEIEARLTPMVLYDAVAAHAQAYVRDGTLQAAHRAWLAVILAALVKE
jgi:hypothetical protein